MRKFNSFIIGISGYLIIATALIAMYICWPKEKPADTYVKPSYHIQFVLFDILENNPQDTVTSKNLNIQIHDSIIIFSGATPGIYLVSARCSDGIMYYGKCSAWRRHRIVTLEVGKDLMPFENLFPSLQDSIRRRQN